LKTLISIGNPWAASVGFRNSRISAWGTAVAPTISGADASAAFSPRCPQAVRTRAAAARISVRLNIGKTLIVSGARP